jgi:hypothetical protein
LIIVLVLLLVIDLPAFDYEHEHEEEPRRKERAGLDRPGKTALPKRPASTTEPTPWNSKTSKPSSI